MDDLEKKLIQLNKNLNVLKLREARFAGNSPLELLNQIDDHEQAIKLLYQARRGEISEDELLDNLHSLTLAIDRGQVINITGDLIINIGDTQLAIPRRLHQAVLGSILLGIIFLVGAQMLDAYQAAPSTPIPRMTGDFNVAVARFHALDGRVSGGKRPGRVGL